MSLFGLRKVLKADVAEGSQDFSGKLAQHAVQPNELRLRLGIS